MNWLIWVVGGLCLIAAEAVMPGGVVLLFFGAAAVIVGAMVAAGIGGPVWVQWAVFSVLSVVSLLTLRGPILRKLKAREGESLDIDAIVGARVIVTEEIVPGEEGRAELRGTSWIAETLGETTLSPGQRCRVESTKGLKLYLREIES